MFVSEESIIAAELIRTGFQLLTAVEFEEVLLASDTGTADQGSKFQPVSSLVVSTIVEQPPSMQEIVQKMMFSHHLEDPRSAPRTKDLILNVEFNVMMMRVNQLIGDPDNFFASSFIGFRMGIDTMVDLGDDTPPHVLDIVFSPEFADYLISDLSDTGLAEYTDPDELDQQVVEPVIFSTFTPINARQDDVFRVATLSGLPISTFIKAILDVL